LRKTYAVAGILATFLIALAAISPLLSARTSPTRIPFSLIAGFGQNRLVSSVNYTAPDGSIVTVNTLTGNVSVTGLIGTTPVSASGVNGVTTMLSGDSNACTGPITGQFPTFTLGPLTIITLIGFGAGNACSTPGTFSGQFSGSGILSINGKATSVTLQGEFAGNLGGAIVLQGLITVG
jgi:hypothetical protein